MKRKVKLGSRRKKKLRFKCTNSRTVYSRRRVLPPIDSEYETPEVKKPKKNKY